MRKVYHSTQICTKCHTEKPLHAFQRRLNGYRHNCKECENARRREIRKEKNPSPLPLPPDCKRCAKCQEIKPLEEFHKDRRENREYVSRCKSCTAKFGRRYPEKMRENHQTRMQGPNFRQKKREDGRRYYAANREKIREREFAYNQANRDTKREKSRQYYAENRLKQQGKYQRRVALQRGSIVEQIDYKRILERDGMFCYICEKGITPEQKIHFDHVIPLARGGPHSENNIKVAHQICNLRKHDNLIEEMADYQRQGP